MAREPIPDSELDFYPFGPPAEAPEPSPVPILPNLAKMGVVYLDRGDYRYRRDLSREELFDLHEAHICRHYPA